MDLSDIDVKCCVVIVTVSLLKCKKGHGDESATRTCNINTFRIDFRRGSHYHRFYVSAHEREQESTKSQ